jgi:hypothetical protein
VSPHPRILLPSFVKLQDPFSAHSHPPKAPSATIGPTSYGPSGTHRGGLEIGRWERGRDGLEIGRWERGRDAFTSDQQRYTAWKDWNPGPGRCGRGAAGVWRGPTQKGRGAKGSAPCRQSPARKPTRVGLATGTACVPGLAASLHARPIPVLPVLRHRRLPATASGAARPAFPPRDLAAALAH